MAGPAWSPFAYFRAPLSLLPVRARSRLGFPYSPLFGLAVPTVSPRPSRRLPLLDFVATTGRGRAPNKETWLQAASPRTVPQDAEEMGTGWSGQVKGGGGPVSLI